MEKFTAIVLAAGTGRRMNSPVLKQYLSLAGKPVLTYALDAFEKSGVTDIVLITGESEVEYCRKEIIEKYGFKKVSKIAAGGKERCHSVYEGLKAAADADYVLIHDGARPFVDADMIRRCMEEVRSCRACIVGVPVKDTIKIVGKDGFAEQTPERNGLWQIQTPQTFSYALIREAYEKMLASDDGTATDDAMAVERMMGERVKVIQGSYRNIKITTPEDLLAAEAFLASGTFPEI